MIDEMIALPMILLQVTHSSSIPGSGTLFLASARPVCAPNRRTHAFPYCIYSRFSSPVSSITRMSLRGALPGPAEGIRRLPEVLVAADHLGAAQGAVFKENGTIDVFPII